MIRSITLATLLLTAPQIAQSAEHYGPTETGQSAFAAISEIVGILENDPNTDWKKVDIQKLRDHLVDMDLVVKQATATLHSDGRTIRFRVSGTGTTIGAIQRMVSAHSIALAKETNWVTESTETNDGATLIVKVQSKDQVQKLKALGFFGTLAIGAHHQNHHLAMATAVHMGH